MFEAVDYSRELQRCSIDYRKCYGCGVCRTVCQEKASPCCREEIGNWQLIPGKVSQIVLPESRVIKDKEKDCVLKEKELMKKSLGANTDRSHTRMVRWLIR